MENRLKRHRSKHSRGPVCLQANSQALGKLIWAEWNTNTLFMEIRPISRQSLWFKEPSAGLARRFSVPPCPPAWPPSCQGKPELIKRCFLKVWKGMTAWVLSSRYQTPMVWRCLLWLWCHEVPRHFSFVLFQVFPYSKFFFLPPLPQALPLLLLSSTLLQWYRDTGTSWFLFCPSVSHLHTP